MAVRLYSEFKSDNGNQYKIEIHDANWLAAASTFNVDSRGFELTYEGQTDDIVSPMVSSRLTFGAYSANSAFETFINTLKTFQENRFKISVLKYNGTSYDLYWAGWILQDLISVEDSSQPYIFEITATDGLGRLANIDYDVLNDIDQGGLKLTRITQFAINALKLAGLYDLWDSNATFLETSADWWETTKHTYSTSTDPLYLTAVDADLLQTYDDDNNLVYNNAFEALLQIATLFNARIYLSEGRWVLEQYGQRASASRYVSRYKYDGTHINRTLVNDDVVVDQTTDAARRSGNNFDFLPAMRKAEVNYIQKFLNPYGLFGGWRYTNATPTFTGGFMAGGPGIQLGIGTASFNFSFKGASTQANLMPLLRATIALQDASGTTYYYGRSFNGTTATSMYTAEGWSVVPGFYYFDLKAISYIANQNATITEVVQIITQDLPTSGLIAITIQLDSIRVMATNAQYNFSSVNIDAPMLFNIVNGGNQSNAGTIFSSVNNEVGIDSQLTLNLGDVFFAEGPPQTGHLAVFDGTSWVGSNLWRKGATGTGLRILKLLTSEALALHARPIERYNGNIIGSFGFESRLNFSSTAYLRTGGSFTANNDDWSGEMYAIQRIRTNISELDEVDVLERVPISGTSTTSGTSPNDINSGRVAGMIVVTDERRLGPFEQTDTGARVNGTLNVTSDVTLDAGLDVDGVSQFNNDVNITGSVTSTGPLTGEYVQLDTDYNTTPVQGQIVWSQDDGTIDVGLNSNVTMQVGQEEFWYVKNQTGSTIAKGTAVRAAGTLGASGRILAAPMIADGSVPARFLLGIAAEDIVDGGEGYVTTFGKIRQLNTSAYTEGAVLWCNPAVAGGLTTTEPSAPNLKLAVAFVVRSNASSGVLAVRSEIGTRVSDASDVQITSVADKDLLQYNTTTSRWENVAGTTTNIGEGTNLYYTDARSRAAVSETIDGISYNNTTGVFSLDAGRVIVTTTQTGQWDTAYNDRIVSAAVAGTTTKTLTLTQGDGGTITASWTDYDTAPVTSVNGQTGVVVLTTDNIGEGTSNLYFTNGRARAALSAGTGITYNNTTGVITNAAPDQVVALTASTAIGVTGTYPNFTIENTAPDQVVALTASTAIGVTGTYPNFTIENTAPDQVVALTASTAIGVTGTYPNFTIENTAPDQVVALTASTAIAVTGTYPNFTIENTAPDQVVALTASTGISITGTYPNFTIENTSPSSGGTITGGGTTNYLSKWTSGSALGDSVIYDDGTNVGIGTATPARKLHVSSADPIILNSTGTTGYGAGIDFNHLGSYRAYVGVPDASAGIAPSQLLLYTGGGYPISFYTNTTEKMRIDTSGNVGIGTTAPARALNVSSNGTAGTQIQINGTQDSAGIKFVPASGDNWEVQANTNNQWFVYNRTDESYRLLIDGSGNVGVGTTDPAAKIQINGAAKITGGDWPTANAGLELNYNSNTSYIGSYDRTNSVYKGLFLFADNMTFETNASVRMYITSGGNVGIGTTNPAYAFDVYRGSGDGARVRVMGSANFALLQAQNDSGALYMGIDSSTANGFGLGNYSRIIWSSGAYPLAIAVGDSERMRITSGGNVGIGTTSPLAQLHVANTMRVGVGFANEAVAIFGDSGTPYWTIGRPAGSGNFRISSYAVNALEIQPTTGNVGIGTTSPGEKLEVNGNINLSSNGGYFLNGALTLFPYLNDTYIRPHTSSGSVNFQNYSGSSTLTITSGGNVGIGTTAPTAKLHVSGGDGIIRNAFIGEVPTYGVNYSQFSHTSRAGAAEYSFLSGNAGDTYVNSANGQPIYFRHNNNQNVVFTADGNVGIGTTAPGGRLEINHTGDQGSTALILRSSNSNGNGTIRWQSSAGANQAAIGSNYNVGDAGALEFINGTTTNVIIRSTGLVGIGTTAPVAQLQVASATNAVDVLRIGNTAGDSGSVQGVTHLAINHFNAGTNPSTRITAYQDGVSGWPGGMYFSTRSLNTDSAPVERMRITSAGNVGIGTTAPSHLLHVAGDVRIDTPDNAPQYNYFDGGINYAYGEPGSQEIILGKPDIWLRINVDGTDYVFPGYNVTA